MVRGCADGIKYVVEACRVLGLKQLGLAYQAAINYKVEAKEKSEDDDIYCMLDAGCWMLLKASQSFISTSNTPKWFRLFERIMNYFWFNECIPLMQDCWLLRVWPAPITLLIIVERCRLALCLYSLCW